MKNISYLLIGLFLSIGQAQNKTTDYTNALKLVSIWLNAQKDYESIPGIMAMIVHNQDVIWSEAIGKSNMEKNTKTELSTVCSICSITKTFTAVAIMKLVDEGKIKLDDKVKDILPHYTVVQKYPEGGAVTIRSLLSHSSGLPRGSGHHYWSAPDFPFPSTRELNSSLKSLETQRPVGADLQYSNLGYALLGQIIEKVSGTSYGEYLKKHVLNPLQMHGSHVDVQDFLPGKAMGYSAINRNLSRKEVNAYSTKAISPGAGLYTTIEDLARYATWQFRLRDATTTEILRPSTLKKMHQVQSKSDNGFRTWGFGFEVFKDAAGNPWISHGGICPGYVSYLKIDLTHKMAYGIMVNANGIKALRLVNGIITILNKVGPSPKHTPKDIDLEEYTGFYNLNPWNSEYYVSPWKDGLILMYLPADLPEQSMYFYRSTGKDTFCLIDSNGESSNEFIVFERDNQGKVYRILNEGNYHQRIERE